MPLHGQRPKRQAHAAHPVVADPAGPPADLPVQSVGLEHELAGRTDQRWLVGIARLEVVGVLIVVGAHAVIVPGRYRLASTPGGLANGPAHLICRTCAISELPCCSWCCLACSPPRFGTPMGFGPRS